MAQRPTKAEARRADLLWKTRIGDAIRAARTRAKLTQKQLAAVVGVDVMTISTIERAEVVPSYAVLETIADVLGVTLDVLVGRAEPTPSTSAGTESRLRDAAPETDPLIEGGQALVRAVRRLQQRVEQLERDARAQPERRRAAR